MSSSDSSSSSSNSSSIDIVSNSTEGLEQAASVTFNQQNNHHHYSLSEMPPLQDLDKCSPETREFSMEMMRNEQLFRHSHLDKCENNRSSELIEINRTESSRKIWSLVAAIFIIIATLAWSLILLLNGQTALGLLPLLILVLAIVASAVYNKSVKVSSSSVETTSDDDK